MKARYAPAVETLAPLSQREPTRVFASAKTKACRFIRTRQNLAGVWACGAFLSLDVGISGAWRSPSLIGARPQRYECGVRRAQTADEARSHPSAFPLELHVA